MQLLVETDIETGMRWGELPELRVKDLDPDTAILTVARVVVNLSPAFHPEGQRFLVKGYPKDGEWRQLKISTDLNKKLVEFATARGLDADDLFFEYVPPTEPKRQTPRTTQYAATTTATPSAPGQARTPSHRQSPSSALDGTVGRATRGRS